MKHCDDKNNTSPSDSINMYRHTHTHTHTHTQRSFFKYLGVILRDIENVQETKGNLEDCSICFFPQTYIYIYIHTYIHTHTMLKLF